MDPPEPGNPSAASIALAFASNAARFCGVSRIDVPTSRTGLPLVRSTTSKTFIRLELCDRPDSILIAVISGAGTRVVRKKRYRIPVASQVTREVATATHRSESNSATGIHGKSLGSLPRLPATKIAASPKNTAAKIQAPWLLDLSTTAVDPDIRPQALWPERTHDANVEPTIAWPRQARQLAI